MLKTLAAAQPTTRRVTVTLEASLVADLTRLASLRGRSFDRELAEDLSFWLQLSGGPTPGDMLEALFQQAQAAEPTERRTILLDDVLANRLTAIARIFGTSRSRALNAILRRGVAVLLRVEALALDHDLTFTEAWLRQMASEQTAA